MDHARPAGANESNPDRHLMLMLMVLCHFTMKIASVAHRWRPVKRGFARAV